MKTNSKLKIWTIVTNIAFILSLFSLSLLLNNNDYRNLGLLGPDFILISVSIVIFLGLTFASAVGALVLNIIYLPRVINISASKTLLRFFVLTLNLIVFLVIIYLAVNYIDWF
jgi:hypothetical protein